MNFWSGLVLGLLFGPFILATIDSFSDETPADWHGDNDEH